MLAPSDCGGIVPRHRPQRDKFHPRLILRYTLLQIPGTLLLVLAMVWIRRWWDVPVWAAGTAVAMWIVKDVLMYPFLWRAYDWDRESENFTMIDCEGTVIKPLDPTGYVRVRGELWKASLEEGAAPLEKGRTVTVREVRGLQLIVRRQH